ncbi:MAG: SusC/RagA family TonB-linked outer membrane protein [Cytophagales bacterium]|nr:SusC/RagA family TonB-linked outer membrane protein [Cytophagales bacterium]
MKTTLLARLLLLCLFAGIVAVRAQSLAMQTAPRATQQGSQAVSLREALHSLETKHKIVFGFDGDLVNNRFVENNNWQKETSLDAALQQLLQPFGLNYKRIRKNTYVIKPRKGTEKEKPTGDLQNSVTPESQTPSSTDASTEANAAVLDIAVTGKVTDAQTGEPLPGVSVALKGTTQGTTTDGKGSYSINVADENAVLVFSFIGYVSEEVTVGNRQTIDLALVADIKSLGEVVVIGYGEQSRAKVTGAISKVQGNDIAIQRVSTAADALAGLAAGVQVQSTRGSTPGAPPVIRVRGISTIGNNDPLYVVDGYPLSNAGQFVSINPNDIESIEILKDAASAAIYGARATNGVVIVTTKRGKAGKTRFELNANTGVQQVSKRIDLMDRDQYLRYAVAAAAERNFIAGNQNLRVPDAFTANPQGLPNTDWQDVIFRDARFSDYQLTARGGNDNTQFLITGGYLQQEGTIKGTSFERFNFRANIDTKLSSKLKLGINFSPSYSDQYRTFAGGQYNSASDKNFNPNVPSIVQTALLMPPIVPEYLPDGRYGQPNIDPVSGQYGFVAGNLTSPLAVINETRNRFRNYRVLTQAFLDYEPIEHLKLRTSFGTSVEFEEQLVYLSPYLYLGGPASTAAPAQPYSQESQGRLIDWLWENTATYARTFGNAHNVAVTGVYSLQRYNSRFTGLFGANDSYTQLLLQNPASSANLLGFWGIDLTAWYSLAGRINYDFRNKYLVSLSVRRDGSSRFGPSVRSANFPAVSVGWRISEEGFMEGIKHVLSEAKIRASYGVTGNANIGSFTWAAGSIRSNFYAFGDQRALGATYSGVTNPNLTWERAEQTDIALDLGFLDNRINVTVDRFVKTNRDFLFPTDLPGSYGTATGYTINAGTIENKGWEFTLGTNFKFGDLTWNVNANLSTFRNRVVDLNGQPQLGANREAVFGWNDVFRLRTGQSIGDMYGYQVEGTYRDAAELRPFAVSGNAQIPGRNRLGDWRIRNNGGPNGVRDTVITVDDMAIIGNAFPDFTYGITNTFQYKNFDLSILLQGSQGGEIINGNLRFLWAGFGNFNAASDFADNYFTRAEPNRDVAFPRLGAGAPFVVPVSQLTNRQIESASFLRVRNITLGYNLPQSLLNKVKLQSARVYFSGQNLFTFTKYTGYNPEASLNGDNVGAAAFQPGVDQGTYPLNRIMTFGLSIGF